MIKLYILCILCILFFGCTEPVKKQEICLCGDFCEDFSNRVNADLIEDNKILELQYADAHDSFLFCQDRYGESLDRTEEDLMAMQDALLGFSECHVAVNCIYYEDAWYENFACSDLTESELQYYIDSCVFSDSYNDFFVYVEEREVDLYGIQ